MEVPTTPRCTISRARSNALLASGRFLTMVPVSVLKFSGGNAEIKALPALNPVRARLVARAQGGSGRGWEWSSARAHLAGRDDGLVRVAPLIERVGCFADLIGADTDRAPFAALCDAESTGRPLGCFTS